MEHIMERERALSISAARRAELEAKEDVFIEEAAEYLCIRPHTLHNWLNAAKKPGQSHLAPPTEGGGTRGVRWRFRISRIKIWRKTRGL